MVALNYEEVQWNSERVSNIKPFINEYIWKGKKYPSKLGDWKTFQENNPTISINVLYIKKKKLLQLIFQKLTQIVQNK